MKNFRSIRNIIGMALVFSAVGGFMSEANAAKKPVSYKCPQCNTRKVCSDANLQDFCIKSCKGTVIKSGVFRKKAMPWDPSAAWKKNCRRKPMPSTWGGAEVKTPGLVGAQYKDMKFYQAGPGASGLNIGKASSQPELAATPNASANPPKIDQYAKAGTQFHQAGPAATGAAVGSASNQPAGAIK